MLTSQNRKYTSILSKFTDDLRLYIYSQFYPKNKPTNIDQINHMHSVQKSLKDFEMNQQKSIQRRQLQSLFQIKGRSLITLGQEHEETMSKMDSIIQQSNLPLWNKLNKGHNRPSIQQMELCQQQKLKDSLQINQNFKKQAINNERFLRTKSKTINNVGKYRIERVSSSFKIKNKKNSSKIQPQKMKVKRHVNFNPIIKQVRSQQSNNSKKKYRLTTKTKTDQPAKDKIKINHFNTKSANNLQHLIPLSEKKKSIGKVQKLKVSNGEQKTTFKIKKSWI